MYRVPAGKPEGKRPTGRTGESGRFGHVHVLGVKLWVPAVTGETKNRLTVPLSVMEAGYVDICMWF